MILPSSANSVRQSLAPSSTTSAASVYLVVKSGEFLIAQLRLAVVVAFSVPTSSALLNSLTLLPAPQCRFFLFVWSLSLSS